ASTVPWRWIAPVRARIASSSVVLPLWNGPTSAMHRGPVARVPFCAIFRLPSCLRCGLLGTRWAGQPSFQAGGGIGKRRHVSRVRAAAHVATHSNAREVHQPCHLPLKGEVDRRAQRWRSRGGSTGTRHTPPASLRSATSPFQGEVTSVAPLRHALTAPTRGDACTLERNAFSSNRHFALVYWWRMIFSENRYPLFGIMR